MDLYDSLLQSATAERLQRARVRIGPAQHSWVGLPGPLVNKLLDSGVEIPVVLRLTPTAAAAAPFGTRGPTTLSTTNFSSSSEARYGPVYAPAPARYVAWAGLESSSPGCIEVPAPLASTLQLRNGVEVVLQVMPQLAAAAAVVVEPVGPDDWEVVEANAGLLQDMVLGQAGVVALGQPFVVWARQAKVTFNVTSIIHEDSAAAAAGAAGKSPAAPLLLRDVAKMLPGTELHIAPKPRLTAAGRLANGHVPLAPAAANSTNNKTGSNTGTAQQAEPGHGASKTQQQQQQRPVWLRVLDADSRHLLDTQRLHTWYSSASNSNGSSNMPEAPAAAAAGPVKSWLTTAVQISSRTAQDLNLQPGGLVRLYGTSSSNRAHQQSVLPLQSLVLLVLQDDAVPWGHVALSHPLQQCLAVAPHQYLKLQPLQAQQQLQQLPGFVLHPLMMGPDNSSSSNSLAEAVAAAAAAQQGTAASRPAAAAASVLAGFGGGQVGLLPARRSAAAAAGISEIEELQDDDVLGAGPRWNAPQRQQQQQQQPGRTVAGSTGQQQQQASRMPADSFSGLGLVTDIVRDLVGTPLHMVLGVKKGTRAAQHSTAQDVPPQHTTAGAAAAAHSRAGQQQQQQHHQGTGAVQQASDVLLPPGVSSAAVLAWLQLQCLATTTAAAAAAAGQAALEAAAAAVLPVCGPMVAHFSVVASSESELQQQEQQQQQEVAMLAQEQRKWGARAEYAGGPSCVNHLLLLVPHLTQQPTATGAQASFDSSRSRSTAPCLLPAKLLLPAASPTGSSQRLQQPQLKVHVAGALTCSAVGSSVQASPVAAQHSKYVSFISSTPFSGCHVSTPASAIVQQQQRPQRLNASDYPWLRGALDSCVKRLQPRLDLLTWQSWQSVELPLPGGVLLVGSSDSGRSWLMQLLGQEAAGKHGAHVLKVSCKALAGQSFDASAAVLAAAAAEALSCCPGLLLLEDLDLLVPAATGEGPAGMEQDQATVARLSDWLSEVMHWAAKQPRPLSFCAAVSAAAALPAALRAAGCLDCEVKVPPLGLQGRAALLLAGFKAKALGFEGGLEELEALAGKGLEGFDARDLQLVVDRAVHAALKRHMAVAGAAMSSSAVDLGGSDGSAGGDGLQYGHQQQQLRVTPDDVRQALSGFVAAAFWRAGQQKSQQTQQEGGLQGWQDVGGLPDAVSALKEALVLPAKYSHLLAAAPLRLRTGLLLFGPPGCGKTHVVAAAVAATGARLISVKGPELLNKYIGQSEAAVRELFSRAAAAAPCVLFFDEFDAIAPPRGHDSTGVTDRVVNQLLTELDGVEGLKGVAVLAATSRPDLIDAALLRPGRLDRMVYCGLPDEAERLLILQAVAHKLPLAADVNLAEVASQTSAFTGADLAAILSEAQLMAVHDTLDKEQQEQQDGAQRETAAVAADGDSGQTASECIVTMQHLQRASSRARPSLPPSERRRLEAVYSRFQQSRDPGLSNRPALPEEEQRRVKHATLA